MSDTPAPDTPNGDAPELVVPVGKIAEILEWVGDDQDRAAAALGAEQLDQAPRATLIAKLEAVLTAETDDDQTDDDDSDDADEEQEVAPADPIDDTPDYFATADFVGMVGVQFVQFKAGARIDQEAALILLAADAPIATQDKPVG